MNGHVVDLLPLWAADALEGAERDRVEAHLRTCASCAALASAWGVVVEELGAIPAPRPSRALVARTLGAVQRAVAEREERVWTQKVLGLLVAFAWTSLIVSWLLADLVVGGLAQWLARPVGGTAAWYGAYLAAGWLSAAVAAALLGRRAREEGRVA
jgi:anti-sigma factor RsiW